jgi:hypothetical protein
VNAFLSPSESASRFEFAGSDCLYRDHFGRRVIAECEGFGCFAVDRADAPINPPATQGIFESGLLILALGDGLVSVAVQSGRAAMPLGETVQVDLPYRGSGWAVDLPAGAAVDDRALSYRSSGRSRAPVEPR